MMGDDMIDDVLAQLRHVPVTGRLDSIDDRVMAMLAERHSDRASMPRLLAVAAVMSLGGGAFAGVAMSEPVAAASLSPLAPANAIAPSVLLDTR